MTNLIFITGGARSGKSSFAERLLKNKTKVTYIATAIVTDEEMKERIQQHQRRRPKDWNTLELPLNPYEGFIEHASDYILLDCISVWISNLLLSYWDDHNNQLTKSFYQILEEILKKVDIFLTAIKKSKSQVIVVSNEVGAGIVPIYQLARYYRDILGIVNQKIAGEAAVVYWCVSGIPVKIKGEDICQNL